MREVGEKERGDRDERERGVRERRDRIPRGYDIMTPAAIHRRHPLHACIGAQSQLATRSSQRGTSQLATRNLQHASRTPHIAPRMPARRTQHVARRSPQPAARTSQPRTSYMSHVRRARRRSCGLFRPTRLYAGRRSCESPCSVQKNKLIDCSSAHTMSFLDWESPDHEVSQLGALRP